MEDAFFYPGKLDESRFDILYKIGVVPSSLKMFYMIALNPQSFQICLRNGSKNFWKSSRKGIYPMLRNYLL
ncbi:MAG: hypothetical protein N2645_11330 [Clostridia bacterium]|nr:hypothetical protein [Clostridia bacterium]